MDNVFRVVEELDLAAAHVVENRIVAQCPYREHEHDFERPGFSVFLDTGHWICFKGCGQGDLVGLISDVQQISLPDAKKWLRKYIHPSIDDVLDSLKKKEYTTPNEDNNYFKMDYEQQDATKTSTYILERGFTTATLKKFGVRIDPVLHCLVIPVLSIEGEVVGVIRREVPGYELPTRTKYWYSPGFSCSDHLFGASLHDPKGSTIIVEGCLDAMWLHQCGYTNTVAILGSYCSPGQQRLLAKLGNTIFVGLDMDQAGQEARKRAIQDLRKNFILKIVEWSEKDPQECNQEQIDTAIRKAERGIVGLHSRGG